MREKELSREVCNMAGGGEGEEGERKVVHSSEYIKLKRES